MISSVASIPSIPGMRRSITITSGRRRSARETAVSPSAASPTTRMCGERSRARRRPSRTTSWSSARRTVISGVSATRRFYGCRSDEGELRRTGRRPERQASRCSHARARAQRTWSRRRRDLVARQVAAAARRVLVAGALLGPVAGERIEEVLARARAGGGGRSPRCGAPRPARAACDRLGELLGPVREPGQDRRDRDVRADAGVDEPADDLEPARGAVPCPARSCARHGRRGSAPTR